MDKRLLGIYLNDHLAGSTLGVELARRLRANNVDYPEFAEPLTLVCAEIEVDRRTLEELMSRNGIRRGKLKPAAAWTAEKLGRLKLNGQLRGYSPLSRLVELETLLLGIHGKAQMWEALKTVEGEIAGDYDFAALTHRADRQRTRVEELHRKAGPLALAS
ncbi:MAG TPA: hypothetical protein VGC49_08840 [Solirubrobacterales bacterium]|jgi:hypothetical protein